MKRYSIWVLCIVVLVCSCSQKITSVSSTAAFYDLGLQHLRVDGNGKDYFQVFAKGKDLADCKLNAKLTVLKTLIYEGYYKGVSYQPILSDPPALRDFRETEQAFYKKWLNNSDMVEVQDAKDSEALSQSGDQPSQYSIKTTVGIDRMKLKTEVSNYLNTNKK